MKLSEAIREGIKLTRMLCTARKLLERVGGENNATHEEEDEVYAWWAEHKKVDDQRKAKEVAAVKKAYARARALERAKIKLSKEERDLLGIK